MQTEVSPKHIAVAAELAAAIQEAPAWKAWQEALKAFEQDTATGELMKRYQAAIREVRRLRAAGQELDGPVAEEWTSVQEAIRANEIVMRREEAASTMVEMLQEVNETLSDALGLDFAGSASSKCGGCHG